MNSKLGLAAAILTVSLLFGCSYVRQRHAIDPPLGCRSCHAEAIEGNWHVLLKPAGIHSEMDSGHPVRVREDRDPGSRQMRSCFVCHHAPDRTHLLYKGIYDH